eukprot:GHVL01030936.1.p1 GENE.GHVL01030936.1~~GHVL01030936.1.p1  ORF type:complete len:103 (+),score=12.57 GHVL01030936.1:159-467(+)
MATLIKCDGLWKVMMLDIKRTDSYDVRVVTEESTQDLRAVVSGHSVDLIPPAKRKESSCPAGFSDDSTKPSSCPAGFLDDSTKPSLCPAAHSTEPSSCLAGF